MRQDKANGNEGVGGAGETIAQQISPDGVSVLTRNGEKTLLLSTIPGLIVAGLVALLVWGVLEVMPAVFELPEHLRELSGNAPEEQQKELLDTSLVVSNKNAALSLVMLISTLGLFLTIAEVKLRHQGLRAIWGGLLAILIAGAFAVGGSILGGMLAASSSLPEDPLIRTIIVQSAMFGLAGLGVGAGVAFATTLPIFRPQLLAICLTGGLLGGLLAGLIFPIVSSILLPNARTEVLMPDPGVSRLLWLTLVSCLSVLTVTGMGKEAKGEGLRKSRVADSQL